MSRFFRVVLVFYFGVFLYINAYRFINSGNNLYSRNGYYQFVNKIEGIQFYLHDGLVYLSNDFKNSCGVLMKLEDDSVYIVYNNNFLELSQSDLSVYEININD